ncbi:hypothetical protein L3X38_014045 [Prunus dulcis]|uniref:PWWP domain-containing protein n=1 Tax=Prunus dulcis TaxID=3755 RepID=A0AAD4WN26_PRUDU|nr:hypothetical protein L3X38_014045 [Prunus dulcis]
MDEQKENDVPVGTGSESTVTAGGHVAGETLAGSEACVSEGLVEGSFTEDAGEDDGGSCNGDDIMVEVLGSNVYVGGVCTSGDGEKSDDEVDRDESDEVDMGSERNVGSLGGDGGGVGEPDSIGGETQVVHIEEAEVVAREVVNSQEVNASDEKEDNSTAENGIGGSSAGALCSETQVVENEGTVIESVEVSGRGLVEVVEQETKSVVGGVDALHDLETQKASVSDDEVWNPGIEKAAVIINEEVSNPKPLSEQTQVPAATGDVAGEDRVDTLTSQVAGKETGKIDENSSHSVEEQLVKIEPVGVSTHSSSNGPAHSVSSSLPAQEVHGGEIAVKGDHDLLTFEKDQFLKPEESVENMVHDISLVESTSVSLPTEVVPGGVVSVTDGGSPSNSVKDQHSKHEKSIDKNMVHDIAQIESNTGQEMEVDSQVNDAGQVGLDGGCGEHLMSNNDVPEPAEKEQPLKSEESLEKTATAYVAPVHPNMDMEGVKEQVTDAEDVLYGGEQIEDKGQYTIGGSTEIAAADDNVLLHPNGQNLKTETLYRSSQTDIQVTDSGDIASMDTEEVFNYASVAETNVVHEAGLKEQVTDAELDGLHGGHYTEVETEATEQPKFSEEEIIMEEAMQPGSSDILLQPRYELPPENEGLFSASDLVWGKVKSHPWWPGQIFDYTVASEKAMKYHKKDCFLVAYFGDRTFAWNEPSSLKPFRSYFPQAEKQCNSEAFQNAVNCALEEVSRRVELGLACSCIPKDVYEKIRFQIVGNAGICQESSRRDEVDESASASSLECNKLLEYIKALARFPSGGSDQLELVIAKAHLLAFYRLKGYCGLPEFQFCGDLLENRTDSSLSEDKINVGERDEHMIEKVTFSGPDIVKVQSSNSNKRKHNLRDGVYSKIKERSLSELMEGGIDSLDGDDWLDGKDSGGLVSPSSGKRRKGFEYHADDLTVQDGRKGLSVAKVSNTTHIPKQSFKIGECIQRVASQLTGSPIVKSNSDRPAGDTSDVAFQSSGDGHRGRAIDPTEYASLGELLSQLQSAAEDPRNEYHFLNTIVSFFTDFRNSVAVGQQAGVELLAVDKVGGKRRKSSNSGLGLPETFEFDDMNDTYWTDRVIQNGAEEPASRRGRKINFQPVVLAQPEKSPQEGRRPYSRRRYSQGNNALPAEKPVGYVDENAPAELVLNFSEVNSVPSETKLNKMFRRFGPLRESETEVDRESSRARVVFKRSSDAEVACNSAGKFNIFGPILVNYQLNYTLSQLNYTPSIQFSASPSATTQDQEMQLVLSPHDHEMHLDLSAHDQMQLDLSTHDQMQLDLSTHDQMQLDLSTHDQMQLDLSTHDQMQLDLSTFENLV